MAYNMLTPYVPPGANILLPVITRQGYQYVLTKRAITDVTPMDNPLWQRLPFSEAAKQVMQSHFVDAFKIPTARGTAVPIGHLVGQPAATIPTNQLASATPVSTSNTNNRGYVETYLEKRRFSYFIAQETELWCGTATGGMIPSEKQREIQRQTKLMMTQIEYDLYTTTAGVMDLMDDSTAGVAAGIPNLLKYNITNWATLGWVPNVNVIGGGTTGATKTAFQPTKITDVAEKHIQDLIMFCNKSGCGKDMHLFVPDIYHNAITNTWQGRPNVKVNVPEAEHGLDMGFEVYRAVSGIHMTIVPNRTMSDEVVLLLDLKQWSKRVGLPFGMYELPQYAPDHGGVAQISWCVIGDPRAGGTFYTANAPG